MTNIKNSLNTLNSNIMEEMIKNDEKIKKLRSEMTEEEKKEHDSMKQKEWRAKNKEYMREYKRKYKEEHREELRANMTAYQRRLRDSYKRIKDGQNREICA